jgi:hypothetical protein
MGRIEPATTGPWTLAFDIPRANVNWENCSFVLRPGLASGALRPLSLEGGWG